jgi:glucose/arabinose dehydrogenase
MRAISRPTFRWKGRVAGLASAIVMAAGCGTVGAPSTTGTPAQASGLTSIGAGLQGPAGLKATVYAKGLPTAATFAFDPQGRLWVATAAARYTGKDGVYLVAGRGATPVKVISDLRTPLGLTWYHKTLYATSIGRVDAYSDLRGTRFGKHQTVITLPAGAGESNNIVQAPDGRMLVGISAPCDHCVPASTWSGTIVSFRPDGSDLRTYATRIRAPFGLTYFPGTSDLFVTMNQRDDLGARTPGDWLAVVREGQDWGFPACYGQGGAACTGAPDPTATLDKHAGSGGVAIVTGQLGPSVGTSAIVAEWQQGKVQRVALTRIGSTYSGSVQPLVWGLKNPLPVLTTPDGALLVGDWKTGTIYRITT